MSLPALARWATGLGSDRTAASGWAAYLVSNASVILSGGSQQGAKSFNNLLLLDLYQKP